MEEFKTISDNVEAEIVEKKSKFIAHVFYIESVEEAEAYIKEMKKKYHDARHNVFAYALETGDGGIAIKFNDDRRAFWNSWKSNIKNSIRKGIIKCFGCGNKIFWRNSIRHRRTCTCLFRQCKICSGACADGRTCRKKNTTSEKIFLSYC